MKVVIQRVASASVDIAGERISEIGAGLLILLGVVPDDTESDLEWLVKKCSQMRIFNDDAGVMNRSVMDVGGDVMVVSQFTLFADTKKGRRPSFVKAAKPDVAIPIYEKFLAEMQSMGFGKVVHGEFGADMQINLTNDGPVTIIIDTDEWRNS